MSKKILLLVLILLAIIFISNFSLAANTVKSTINSIDDDIANLSNGLKNGTSALGNNLQGAMNNAGNAIKSGENTIDRAAANTYVATRTATDNLNNQNMNATWWTWIIIGIAAIVIIALIWYYTVQDNRR